MIKWIEFTYEMEKQLLDIHCKEEGIYKIIQFLKNKGLDITPEDAEWLLCEISALLREKVSNPLILQGFDTLIKEDGSLCLSSYCHFNICVYVDIDNSLQTTEVSRDNIAVSFNHYAYGTAPVAIIPNNVTEIKQYCFSFRSDLKKVVVPESVTKIREGTFLNCSNLEEVILPETIVSIERGAFIGCSNLKNIKLPKYLSAIGSEAFYGCESLTYIELPETLYQIGYGAFAKCTGLLTMKVPDGLEIPLEKHVFYGCDKLDLSDVYFNHFSVNGRRTFRDLVDALNIFALAYMDRTNLSYSFNILEIDKPSSDFVEKRVSKSEWDNDIRYFLNHSDWVVLDSNKMNTAGRISSGGSRYLERIIVDTLRLINVELFCCSDEGLLYYEKALGCVELINIRYLHIWNKWFALILKCSD